MEAQKQQENISSSRSHITSRIKEAKKEEIGQSLSLLLCMTDVGWRWNPVLQSTSPMSKSGNRPLQTKEVGKFLSRTPERAMPTTIPPEL